jgi:ATP-dependent protease ClpP protease subunit
MFLFVNLTIIVILLRILYPKSSNILLHNDINLIKIDREINMDYVNIIIDNLNKFKENDTVKFFINSNGGEIISGYKLILTMDELKNNNISFDCYAFNAHSIAFDIYQRCSKRYSMIESHIMQHNARINTNMDLDKLFELVKNGDIELLKMINDKLDLYSSKKANISIIEYKQKIKKEYNLKGYEILNAKFSDEMIVIDDLNFLIDKLIF